VEKLRADDRLVTSPVQMLNEVEAVLDAVTVLQAVAVRRLRDITAVDAAAQITGRGPRAWLHEDCLLPAAEAGRLMRLARSLPAAPATEAAFASGAINSAHAAAITTALATVPAEIAQTVERLLLDQAETCVPEDIAPFMDQLLDGLGIDKASDIARERRNVQRGVDIGKMLDGHRSLAGTLNPEVAAKLEQALALAGQPAGPEDRRTRRQRHHDALGDIADCYLAASDADMPALGGAPRTVIVTMDLATLESDLRDRWIALPDGGQISAAAARRLACDAALIPAVLGGASELLDIGQADHEFTTAIRRAAWLRDGGRCAFPGCRNRPAEAHHVTFRRHGGPTSVDNCAWLCAFHHWLAHEGGWSLKRDASGDYRWTGPYGHVRVRHIQRA
jgi:hypothetical protein